VSYAIAAAGTGGHVFPGLAVGEALVERGVDRGRVLFIGGDRLEARVYPEAGFPFFATEVRGLERRATAKNLTLPAMVIKATDAIGEELRARETGVVLCMGGYVSVPAARAARRQRCALFVSEQNAEAGLASRYAARNATKVFGSFPSTGRLPSAEWVGNPIRSELAEFSRPQLREAALAGYGLATGTPVLGVFGGSLGSRAINLAVFQMVSSWEGPRMQVLHLVGERNLEHVPALDSRVPWKVVGFEPDMARFYAACDLVVARAGGAVAELTATATPSILVPGEFGSGKHQSANAAALRAAGAAEVIHENQLRALPGTIARLLSDEAGLEGMSAAARSLGKPAAADTIAEFMAAAHG
jgi:UDP-N-acetylglucosamine--N-acetylmuramyl-(pentapeptide) pyrophosphoryl-undecaprenol N-acetylglucosamine transferase